MKEQEHHEKLIKHEMEVLLNETKTSPRGNNKSEEDDREEEDQRFEFQPKRKVGRWLHEEEMAGPIQRDNFRLGLLGSRPDIIT